MKYTPYYFQTDAVNTMFDYYMSDDAGHALIVLPTGTGKSLVQSMIAVRMINDYPGCRILFLTHKKDLIEQNYNELITNLGLVNAGIYSAGLNCRDTDNQILFAGIQSVHKRALELGRFNLIIVDEAHLISNKAETMYHRFLDDMFEQAPHCKVVGLTATEYRMDTGLLIDGENKIFDEVIYKYPLYKAIKEGYVCKPIGKAGMIKPDVSGVHKRAGEYIESELAAICDNDIIIRKAVAEIIKLTTDRNHMLLFCVGIEHAQHVSEEMTRQGMHCEVVHSKLSDSERVRITTGFKNGTIRAVANCDLWTTGFNARHVDCIILLRPTKSTGLYYQMCGRGFRTLEGKENFLILDYAGCILEHGPLDKIEVESKGRASDRGVHTAPMKECPECKQPVFLSTTKCPHCGYEWPVSLGHGGSAEEAEPISKYIPPVEIPLEPYDTTYYAHESKSGNICMRVSYSIALLQHVDDYVCIEHGGFAESQARKWLKEALPVGYPIPDTVEECMGLTDIFKKPESIFVDYNQKFPKIISRIYPDETGQEKTQNKSMRSFIR
jgi:DNA repair protein RadD